MLPEIKKLNNVWLENQFRANQTTEISSEKLKDLSNSIMTSGPFFFYIIDFFDMSISHISPNISDFHKLDASTVSFNDILAQNHPDDVPFIIAAEEKLINIFSDQLEMKNLLNYKLSYCFRTKMKDGSYALINHQAIVLTLDSNNRFGKSLNIHTRIDHLTTINPYTISLIPIDGKSPSYMNITLDKKTFLPTIYSSREIDIIKLVSEGLINEEISQKLFISIETVKKHRNNILRKGNSKNTAELIKNCLLQGII